MEYYIGYIACGIAILVFFFISLFVQAKVNSNYNKYKEVPSSLDCTGAELVERLSSHTGVAVNVYSCHGKLSDHYNPKNKSINISEENFHSKSIASHAIVAHEFGHALQHAKNYGAYNVRQAVVKVSNFVSGMLFPIIIVGLILELIFFFTAGRILIYVMCGVYGISVIAGLVTLPVEFNASTRAKKLLIELGSDSDSEKKATKEMLNSAALTYVASLFVTLAYFLRFLFIILGSRRD